MFIVSCIWSLDKYLALIDFYVKDDVDGGGWGTLLTSTSYVSTTSFTAWRLVSFT